MRPSSFLRLPPPEIRGDAPPSPAQKAPKVTHRPTASEHEVTCPKFYALAAPKTVAPGKNMSPPHPPRVLKHESSTSCS